MLGRLSSSASSSRSTRNFLKIVSKASPTAATTSDVSLLFCQEIATKPSLLFSSASPTTITKRWHGGSHVDKDAPTVSIVFLQPDGETKKTVQAKVGESFLQTAHRNDIDLEGACEGM